jgi:hypothetical protein
MGAEMNPDFSGSLQYYWFIHMGIRKKHLSFRSLSGEDGPGYTSMKRFEEGRLTRQDAAELLGLVWVVERTQSVSGSYFEKEAAGSLLQQVT